MRLSMLKDLRIEKGNPITPIANAGSNCIVLEKLFKAKTASLCIMQAVTQGILSENPPISVEIEWKSFKTVVFNDSLFVFDIIDGAGLEDAPSDAEIRKLFEACAKSAGKNGLPWRLRGLWEEITTGRTLPFGTSLTSVKVRRVPAGTLPVTGPSSICNAITMVNIHQTRIYVKQFLSSIPRRLSCIATGIILASPLLGR